MQVMRVFDRGAFADTLGSSKLCAPNYYIGTHIIDSLFKAYDTVLSYASLVEIHMRFHKPQPRFQVMKCRS